MRCSRTRRPTGRLAPGGPAGWPGRGVVGYCYQPVSGPALKETWAVNADGTGNQRILSASIGLNYPDWSPNGLQLAVVGYVSDDTWSIHVAGADGASLARVTTADGVLDGDPSWSPDGTKIAFTRVHPRQNNRSEIWVVDVDRSARDGRASSE